MNVFCCLLGKKKKKTGKHCLTEWSEIVTIDNPRSSRNSRLVSNLSPDFLEKMLNYLNQSRF